MRTGFTYKGVHSSAFGLCAATKSRQILPPRRSNYADVPLRDGNIDFSAANEYGRAFYEKRTFSAAIYIRAIDIGELQNKISDCAVWLCGSGELIFDDMPLCVWDAAVVNGIDYAPELSGTKAVISVSFEAEPYSRGLFNAARGVYLGDDIPIGARVPMGLETVLAHTLNVTSTSGEYILSFTNAGSAYARPHIFIERADNEAIGDVTVSCGSLPKRTLSCKDMKAADIELDLENFKLWDGTTNKTGMLGGEFFELAPGVNRLGFGFSKTGAYSVKIDYTPRFIYGADYNI